MGGMGMEEGKGVGIKGLEVMDLRREEVVEVMLKHLQVVLVMEVVGTVEVMLMVQVQVAVGEELERAVME
jgi:hypothetical protein